MLVMRLTRAPAACLLHLAAAPSLRREVALGDVGHSDLAAAPSLRREVTLGDVVAFVASSSVLPAKGSGAWRNWASEAWLKRLPRKGEVRLTSTAASSPQGEVRLTPMDLFCKDLVNPLAAKAGDLNLQTQTHMGSTKVSGDSQDPWLCSLPRNGRCAQRSRAFEAQR